MVRRNWTDSTLRERLEELRKIRGVGWNEFARQCGIDSGTMSRLGRRTKKPDMTTLGKIAEASHVSIDWLALGVGRFDASPPSSDERDRFPNRQEAARIAREGGLDEEPIAAVLREAYGHLEKDPSILWWIHQIEATHLLIRGSSSHPPPRQVADTPVAESVRQPRKRARVEK